MARGVLTVYCIPALRAMLFALQLHSLSTRRYRAGSSGRYRPSLSSSSPIAVLHDCIVVIIHSTSTSPASRQPAQSRSAPLGSSTTDGHCDCELVGQVEGSCKRTRTHRRVATCCPVHCTLLHCTSAPDLTYPLYHHYSQYHIKCYGNQLLYLYPLPITI